MRKSGEEIEMHPQKLDTLGGAFLMAKKGQVFKKYSPEFKLSVILDMRENHLTYTETMSKWLPNVDKRKVSIIRRWERKHLEEGYEGLMKDNRGNPSLEGKKLDNLVEAITNGIYSSKTKQVLDELEERKKNLEEELYQEELDHPVVSEEQILHALYHYKNLDISTKEGKQRLIDGFVNSIYLYDDRYVITFNYKNKSKTVTFEEIESSSLTSKASPKKKHTQTSVFLCFLKQNKKTVWNFPHRLIFL